jgi:hypothetical protein
MVSYNVNRIRRTFEIFPPSHKCLPNGQEFLVVGIVVQFGVTESMGVKCNWVDVVIQSDDRDYSGDCIVRSVGFDDERSIWNKMGAELKVDLSLLKAERHSSVKFHCWPLQVRQARGRAIST